MASRLDVVKGVEDNVERLHVSHPEQLVLDVAMVCLDFYVLVEAASPRISVHNAQKLTDMKIECMNEAVIKQ